ncbi:MAG TPA: LL-diaminopimelate aminotransferase [Actinomycetota bacterium]|nr:LL-diaminopimelate aminotransferase [Actinomycetota bacterium]
MRIAKRVESLPPYLFAELDKRVAAKRAEGADVISLGVGDPDLPTPPHVVEALREAALDPSTHRYPSYYGMPELRQAVADYYERRFGVLLDPETEVLPLIGSKEGIAHIATAFVDPGDRALVADPGYPVYGIGTILAGGEPVSLPLTAGRRFLPDYDEVEVPPSTTIMWLGYPSNPTAAVAEADTLERTVRFGADHDLLVCHDAAYVEITFDGYVAPSILQIPGAKDVAVEFGSLSKTYNMTGWRIGYVVGNADAIRMLGVVKTNIDSGIFDAVQRAAIAALTGPQDHVEQMRAIYQKRRDLIVSALAEAGIDLEPPLGSIYVWVPAPPGKTSVEFTAELLDEAAVVVAPGTGYGPHGEGYIRISLSVPDDRLQEAAGRLRERLR